MRRIVLFILIAGFLFISTDTSFARRIKEIPQSIEKDYYICLRNLLAKYMPFSRADNFMRRLLVNQQLYDKNSPRLQEICKRIRKSIFDLENSRIDLSLLTYFLDTVLTKFEVELYNHPDPETYGRVLDIIVEEVIRMGRNISGKPEEIYRDVISRNSSRDNSIGAFFAQLFNTLYIQSHDFTKEYGRFEAIVSGDSYLEHTKHQILVRAEERISEFPDEAYAGMPEIELLIAGTYQKNLFIKFYSTASLASICMLEGISSRTRKYIFQAALNGLKNIPCDFFFDRNKGEIPTGVAYVSACIGYLINAERVCRALAIDVDLVQDEEFKRIFNLLLLKGFDLESKSRFTNPN